jgi:hypothetical protein
MYEDVLAKMREVNSWSNAQLNAAIESAQSLADERSQYFWHVDMSWLESGSYHLLYRLDGNG